MASGFFEPLHFSELTNSDHRTVDVCGRARKSRHGMKTAHMTPPQLVSNLGFAVCRFSAQQFFATFKGIDMYEPKPDVCRPSGSRELPMLDVYMPMMKSAAVISAGRLGLFEALSGGPLSVQSLAEKINASAAGTVMLSNFLVTVGYLESRGQSLANTPSTQRWFTSGGSADYTAGLLWTQEAWPMMQNLAEAVRDGSAKSTLWGAMVETPRLGAVFSEYMASFAKDLGPDLAEHVKLNDDATSLVDLGGSHGLHSINFCRRYAALHAKIVDFPSALADTEAKIDAAGLADRIRLHHGNIVDTDWGSEHDAVFYLCVAHNQTPETNRDMIQRVAKSLRPGGMLVIHDYIDESSINPFRAAFNLTLFFETGTKIHSFDMYSQWLQGAGFLSMQRIDLDPIEKGSLILARM
jgi:predicted O-methyltransferase YrrM